MPPYVRGRKDFARFATRLALPALVTVFLAAAVQRAEAATTTTTSCYVATGAAAHVLCFLDFTGYPGTGTQTFTINIPDGSTLKGTIANTGTKSDLAPVAVPVYTTATYGGVAFGIEDYVGVLGDPAFYPGADVSQIVLSNLVLTDAQGNVLPNVTMAGVDAESTDTGDGTTGALNWTTTGTNWTQLQLMPNPTGSITSVCALSGLGTQTAKCVPNGNGAPSAAYILTTTVTNAQTLGMSAISSAKEAFAFGIELSQITVAKTVASREAAGDQFTVAVTRGGTVLKSASTTGTGTSATAAASAALAGETYVLTDSAAAGSTTKIANYASTVACANATAGSATVLPATNASAQSVSIKTAADDQITCTFTNNALGLTDTAVTPTQTVTAGTTVTDAFTLKNTSAVPGTFAVVAPTIVTSTGATVAPAGYTFGGTTYATLSTLQAAITAAGPTAAGGSIVVGVTYAVPGTSGTAATVTFSATIASGTGTAPQATASEVDTISPTTKLAIAKTGTTASSPGGLIAYSILVTNPGPSAANGATLADPVPAGIAITGTPACGAPTGGAVCGSVSVTGQTVASTITTLPVGGSVTFTITGTAATAATYTNTATVTPPTGIGGPPASSSLATVVSQASGLQKTVQDVTQGTPATATSDLAAPGDTLRYTLTFTNTTGAPIANLSFKDLVRAHTTFVAAACPGGGTTLPAGITCSPTLPAVGSTGTNVTFSYAGTLAAGATVAASIDVKVQ